jgi:hypothetical protein
VHDGVAVHDGDGGGSGDHVRDVVNQKCPVAAGELENRRTS